MKNRLPWSGQCGSLRIVSRARAFFTIAALLLPVWNPVLAQDRSLRFFGHGSNDIDRVKIPIDAPARPVDVGGDFTIEFWMNAVASENSSGPCTTGADAWINGNIIIDRDIFGPGESGDFGISLYGSRIAFGVADSSSGQTICGATDVADGVWHHVAVVRNATTGAMRIFIDGNLDGSGTGPTGNVAYDDGRATSYPNSDPYLVIGAEKHDAGPAYPSYSGFLDELRVSDTERYTANFTAPTAPFVTDANTMGLYHFDAPPADATCACSPTVSDVSGATGGPSNGVCKFGGGGTPGPLVSSTTPFSSGSNAPVCPPSPNPACRTSQKAKFQVLDDADDGRDRLAWKWLKGAATNSADFGDPVAGGTGYRLCVYGQTAGVPALLFDAAIPGDGDCSGVNGWKAAGTSGFKFRNKAGLPAGVNSVSLKAGVAGKAKVIVKGKGSNLDLAAPPFPADPAVVVQFLNALGECWGSTHANPDENTAGSFRDNSP